MSLRLPGGGKKLKKQLTYRHMKELVIRQQEVINTLCQIIDEAKVIIKNTTDKPENRIISPQSVPFIVPTGRNI